MLSRRIAHTLSQHETPFYLYDLNLLRQTMENLKWAADQYGYKLHYAIKANFDARILEEIRRFGIGIDCASGNELKMALESGFAADTIVYAGVGKRDRELAFAIDSKILSINCESIQELGVIESIAAERGAVADVCLRINPDIDPRTNRCIDTGQADSKFGISFEEVLENVDYILGLKHVNVIGLHLHIGSQIRELHVFENMCRKVNSIFADLTARGFELRMVDVGGGLGINYDLPENEPIANFASMFAIVAGNLEVGDAEVHFEFGRSIVAQCGELITRVLFNKTTATGRRLLIVDASMTELIRPALYGAYHNIENISAGEDRKMSKYTVVGTACESTDVFDTNVSLPETRRGDLLTIKSAGAYGMSMASRYNLHDLPGAVYYE